MSKGSKPRPFSVKDDVFSESYCNTFGHKWRDDRCMNCYGVREVQAAQGKNKSVGAEVHSRSA